MVRPPMPPTYFFALDVSAQSVSSGFLVRRPQCLLIALHIHGGDLLPFRDLSLF